MTRFSVHILAAAGLLTAASISVLPAIAADNMQTAEELRTSKLVGSRVYNSANENIGSIEDIILKPDGSMDEVVLSVGGFLGMGDKYVAVPFSDLKITRDGSSQKIVTNGTKKSLKAQPAYQFFKS
jgi:sporulation protein YlmC with PRC-barrel domain